MEGTDSELIQNIPWFTLSYWYDSAEQDSRLLENEQAGQYTLIQTVNEQKQIPANFKMPTFFSEEGLEAGNNDVLKMNRKVIDYFNNKMAYIQGKTYHWMKI